jgi:hypothetical protein
MWPSYAVETAIDVAKLCSGTAIDVAKLDSGDCSASHFMFS